MKILITGGPVFEHLDSVKIITNKFKGGMIASLADHLEDLGAEITYLCSRGSSKPEYITGPILTHNGYEDYKNQVLALAPKHDAVILGAAVCNLIPDTPWKNTKFPSHDYNEGDRISVDFIVAPRIINMVKAAAPKTILIGFKLLDNVSEEVLIDAAYDVLLGSGASFVVANDANNLSRKLIITKEKSAIPVDNLELGNFIYKALSDKYYNTWIEHSYSLSAISYGEYNREIEANKYILEYGFDSKRKMYFGCVAVRHSEGFLISPRGKANIHAAPTLVSKVNHNDKIICVQGPKASLNAPLIDRLFEKYPKAKTIIHSHLVDDTLPTYEYAFPGSVRDTDRKIEHTQFNIQYHGSFYVY